MCEFTGALCEHEFSLFLDSQVATHIFTPLVCYDELVSTFKNEVKELVSTFKNEVKKETQNDSKV